MEHTTKYGFNLLQGTDPISPKPLNDNMKKVETAFNDAEKELIKKVGTGGMNARIASGWYKGEGASDSAFHLKTGFKPVFLAVSAVTAPYEDSWNDFEDPVVAIFPAESIPARDGYATIVWNGTEVVWMPRGRSEHCPFFEPGRTYTWVAIGYDESNGTE